jgi:hypothetical protein
MASSTTTTDHEEIRQWVEERGGWPARVKGTGGGDDPGMIRIDFPGFSGEDTLERLEWDDWFQAFEENGLALVVEYEQRGGEPSRFNKIIRRESKKDGKGAA